MRRQILTPLVAVCVASCFALPRAAAQGGTKWAMAMVKKEERSFDFGKVASGSKVHHIFKFKNIYKEDIRISGVSSSCGCANPKITRSTAGSREEAEIRVDIDTVRHKGQKSPKLTITFDKPSLASIVIPMKVYIRTDIVLSPDAVKFGVIPEGKGYKQTLKINYAGRSDWSITGARTTNKNLKVEVKETKRQGGIVSYELIVKLLGTMPAGKVEELVVLSTDDKFAKSFPVQVIGTVRPEYSVSPSQLAMGSLAPGAAKRMFIIVRGDKPFKVDCVECGNGKKLEAKLANAKKRVHIINVTYNSPTTPGQFSEEFVVKIDGRAQPLRLRAYGTVVTN